MPGFRSALAAALLATGLVAAPADEAAAVSIQIDTTLTSNPAFIFGPLAGLFTPGEAIEITLTFDNDAPDGDVNPGQGIFVQTISQLDVHFPGSGLTFLFGNPFSSMGTADDNPPGNDSIAFSSSSRLGGDVPDGNLPTSISVTLLQDDGSNDLVVNDRPSLPLDFNEGTFTLITDDVEFTQMLLDGGTSTDVPEPSLAALLVAGLLGVASRRRR